jgi:hypothetical protein
MVWHVFTVTSVFRGQDRYPKYPHEKKIVLLIHRARIPSFVDEEGKSDFDKS